MRRLLAIGVVLAIGSTAAFGMLVARWRGDRLTHRADIGPSTVVLLGDSLTEMGRWDDLLPETEVSNHGYSGYTSQELVEIAADVAADRPGTVLLLTGTNDIRDGHPPVWTAREIGIMLDHFDRRSPETRIVLQSVLPRADAPLQVAAVNEVIAAVAAERGHEYLDLHPSFDRGDGGLRVEETTDGIHLSDAGYDRWAEELRRFLAPVSAAGEAEGQEREGRADGQPTAG